MYNEKLLIQIGELFVYCFLINSYLPLHSHFFSQPPSALHRYPQQTHLPPHRRHQQTHPPPHRHQSSKPHTSHQHQHHHLYHYVHAPPSDEKQILNSPHSSSRTRLTTHQTGRTKTNESDDNRRTGQAQTTYILQRHVTRPIYSTPLIEEQSERKSGASSRGNSSCNSVYKIVAVS